MIFQEQQLNKVIGLDKDSTVNMTIDESNTKKLMAILSTNLYQDPIGSIIREYVSNALDTQREVGNNDPIKVRLVRENRNFVFQVIDNGMGLSPERVENVFSKYLSSTKEKSIDQLGYYGLGSKSALSYTDSFHIHSRYEGKLYSYMMLKGEEGTELSLLDINDTTDKNGVTISITLKNDNDYEIFLEKIQYQLCYFEGVFIETEYDDIDNNFKIIKTEDWKYSEMNVDHNLHLCLDNVYYPLDFKKLGIEVINLPIGLNFSLRDGITPIPSREGFLYSPVIKEMILERLTKVSDYFINKWNESMIQVETLEEGNNLKNNMGQILLYSEDILGLKKEIYVKVPKQLEKFSTIEMKGVCLSLFPNLSVDKLYKNRSYMFDEYKVFGIFEGGSYKSKFGSRNYDAEFVSLSYYNIQSNHVILLPSNEALTISQIKYLRWLSGKNYETYYIIRKHSNTKLGKYNRWEGYASNVYRGILDLHKKPKNKWREIITEYQKFINSYTSEFEKIDIYDPEENKLYQEFLEESKVERKKAKYNTKEEITYSTLRYPATTRAKARFLTNSDFTTKLFELRKMKALIVYSDMNDASIDESLFTLFRNNNKLRLVVLSERNYQKLEKYQKENPIHNWININTFYNKKNRFLSRFLTKYLIDKVEDIIDNPQLNPGTNILDNRYVERGRKISDYIRIESSHNRWGDLDDNWLEDKLRLYYTNRWLDNNIIDDFIKHYTNIHRFDFMDVINSGYTNEELVKRLGLMLYLKQSKREKAGKVEYERINVKELVDNFANPPLPVIEEEEIIDNNIKENVEELIDIPF